MLKKSLLISAVTVMLLSSSVYASSCSSSGRSCSMSQMSKMTKGQHGSSEKGSSGSKMHLVKKIVAAVSKTGLSSNQVDSITSAIAKFKETQQSLKGMKLFPIDALGDDTFDSKAFMKAKQEMFNKKLVAVTQLFEAVYTNLNPEQRKIFKREFTAPFIAKMIKKEMKGTSSSMPSKGSMMKCGAGKCGSGN